VREALDATRAHNIRAGFAASDACRLPFAGDAFDATFCVAVLQHVRDLSSAVREFARVTKPGGRVLVVEPDNAARYWYSSTTTADEAFETATRFFRAIETRGDATDLAVGPRISTTFTQHGIEPKFIRLFLVSRVRLGAPAPSVWQARGEIVQGAIDRVQDESLRRQGRDYLRLLERYAEEATAAGPRFVEIQGTTLFATVGRKLIG